MHTQLVVCLGTQLVVCLGVFTQRFGHAHIVLLWIGTGCTFSVGTLHIPGEAKFSEMVEITQK